MAKLEVPLAVSTVLSVKTENSRYTYLHPLRNPTKKPNFLFLWAAVQRNARSYSNALILLNYMLTTEMSRIEFEMFEVKHRYEIRFLQFSSFLTVILGKNCRDVIYPKVPILFLLTALVP